VRDLGVGGTLPSPFISGYYICAIFGQNFRVNISKPFSIDADLKGAKFNVDAGLYKLGSNQRAFSATLSPS